MSDPAHQALLSALADPFAELLRGDDGEPDLFAAARLLPPLVGGTFLGGRDLADKPLVEPDGTIRGIVGSPLTIAPGDMACYGDRIPACLDLLGTRPDGVEVRRLLFAVPEQGRTAVYWMDQMPAVRCHRHDGKQLHEIPTARLEAALAGLVEQQAGELTEAATIKVPELFRLCARLSILRALNAFVDRHPKYGWGGYEDARHDTFPPAILALTHALIDYSLLSTAKELLGHWLDRFVTADGELAYYGPSLSEAGMLLDLAVRLGRASRDRSWFESARPGLHRIADRLVRLRVAHDGLVPGLPEADLHQDAEVGQTIYYSNNMWAVRGLVAFGQILDDGTAYLGPAEGWSADIRTLLQMDTWALSDGQLVIAAAAGDHTPFARLTADRTTSYANYRFYPEMLSSRHLTPRQAEALFELRETRGGELAGTTRFLDRLDDWPAAEMGLAHLDHDRREAAQRLLVGHLAFHHAAGHQTAYEQVGIEPAEAGWREPRAGFCVPAQMVVPRLLRNLLVHEAADALWLNRAAFRRWLGEGYGVENMTTRWGRISFTIGSDGEGVELEVDGSDLQPEVPLRCRLVRPDGRPLTRLEVNGRTVEIAGDTVSLPRGEPKLSVRAS